MQQTWGYWALKRWQHIEELRTASGVGEPLSVSALRHPALRVGTWIALYPLVPTAIGVLSYKAAVYWWWSFALFIVALGTHLVRRPGLRK